MVPTTVPAVRGPAVGPPELVVAIGHQLLVEGLGLVGGPEALGPQEAPESTGHGVQEVTAEPGGGAGLGISLRPRELTRSLHTGDGVSRGFPPRIVCFRHSIVEFDALPRATAAEFAAHASEEGLGVLGGEDAVENWIER